MIEPIQNFTWGIGIRTAAVFRRVGMLAPIIDAMYKVGRFLAPPPNEEVTIALPYLINLVMPAGYPSSRTILLGHYEKETMKQFVDLVKTGMTVVDVGANIGYYTLMASRLTGDRGRVYAFEADSDAFASLQRNLTENNCQNLVPVCEAVSNEEGTALFCCPEPERAYIVTEPSAEIAQKVVPTTSLDQFFARQNWPAVDVIKMDIEGEEQAALQGMKELSRRNPSLKLIVEFNMGAIKRSGTNPVTVISTLRELGFTTARIIERGLYSFSLDSQSLPKELIQPNAMYNLLCSKQ